MRHFWNWTEPDPNAEKPERTLRINGAIAEDSWFDDDITPKMFAEELHAGTGDVTVWINSPGGDCVAAAQIYNMLSEYPGNITVKVDGLAASAASVIAMAGNKVLMSPVALMMIHNPMTVAFGDKAELKQAIEMLGSVKDSIINAYERKTGLSRDKLSHLMDAETWMDAHKAVEFGFADGIIGEEATAITNRSAYESMMFSKATVVNSLMEKIAAKAKIDKNTETDTDTESLQAQADIQSLFSFANKRKDDNNAQI